MRKTCWLMLATVFATACTHAVIWEEGIPSENGYYTLEPLGEYFWQPEYGVWAYHTWLGWLEARTDSLESFQFFRLDTNRSNRGELFWTSGDQFPVVYSMGRYERGNWEDVQYWALLESVRYKKVGIESSGASHPWETSIVWAFRYDLDSWDYLGEGQRELAFEREYKNGDLEGIRESLLKREISPLPVESRTQLPIPFQEAYAVYETFFGTPGDYDASPRSEDAMLVIPGEISISVYERIAKHDDTEYYGHNLLYELTLKPFRPDLTDLEIPLISSQNFRTEQILEFLRFQETSEKRDRADFLDPILTPVRGGWDRFHQVMTFPVVNRINLNEKYTRALIDFSDSGSGSGALFEAFYEKEDGIWVERYSKIVGIP